LAVNDLTWRQIDDLRRVLFKSLLTLWVAAERAEICDERAKRRTIGKEYADRCMQIHRAKLARNAARAAGVMSTADAERVLERFNGPGGAARYNDPVVAREMRRLYSKAYAVVWTRSPKGRAAQRVRDSLRRVNPRSARPGDTSGFYLDMLLSDVSACFYCAKELRPDERFGDHFVPLAKGGTHSGDNLVIACGPCNQDKRDRMPDEFIASRYILTQNLE
jgi:5-methylcytosine-specific restriction endonuclease McrA